MISQKNYSLAATFSFEIDLKFKLFSQVPSLISPKANTTIGLFDTGQLGSMPKLYKNALLLGQKAADLFSMKPSNKLIFERLVHFDPLTPSHFLLTSSRFPIAKQGRLDIKSHKGSSPLLIEKIYLEEKRGRFIDQTSLFNIDYNEAGKALLKIKIDFPSKLLEELGFIHEQLFSLLHENKILRPAGEGKYLPFDLEVKKNHDEDLLELKNIPHFLNTSFIENEVAAFSTLSHFDLLHKYYSSLEKQFIVDTPSFFTDEPDIPSICLDRNFSLG